MFHYHPFQEPLNTIVHFEILVVFRVYMKLLKKKSETFLTISPFSKVKTCIRQSLELKSFNDHVTHASYIT